MRMSFPSAFRFVPTRTRADCFYAHSSMVRRLQDHSLLTMDDEIEDRIERLKRQAASLSGGRMRSGVAADCPPEVEEQFWRQVVAFESPGTTGAAI